MGSYQDFYIAKRQAQQLKDAGFETIEENIRSQWNPEESDFVAVDNLVKNLLK